MKRLSTMLLILSLIVMQISYVPQRALANEADKTEVSQEKPDVPDSGEAGRDENKSGNPTDEKKENNSDQNTARQEPNDQDSAAQEVIKQETDDQDSAAQDVIKEETGDQDSAAQDVIKQETGDQDSAAQDAGKQETGNQDSAAQDASKQATGDQDAARQGEVRDNTPSGNSASGNSVSDNAASDKNVSGNAVSSNAVSINGLLKSSGTEAVSLEIKDEIIQLGGFPQEKDESDINKDNLQGRSGEDSFEDKLTKALDDREENLDVSGYDLSVDEVKQQVIDVINDNPSFFSVEDVSVDLNRASNTVSNVLLKYSSNADDRSESYESEVENILAGIKSSWNNEKKLFYLHDYLVTHCQYDFTYSKYSAYNAIVEHSAVCQGYSLAFADLATRAGIPTQVVTSSGLNHAWNISTLNGKKYYTDCTWDDPSASGQLHWYRMRCRHNSFLASQSQMTATKHTSTDWVVGSTNVYGSYNYTDYDNAGWRQAEYSATAYPENGSIYYLNSEDWGIYSYDCNRGAVEKKASMGSTHRWPAYGSPNSFYREFYGTLTGAGNMIWVNDQKTIYRFNPSNNTLTDIYTLNSSEQNSGQIFGIELEGSRIRYDLATGFMESELVRSGYVDVTSSTGNVVTGVSLNREYVLFGNAGESVSLTATVTPSGAGSVTWSSSDTSIATVANGLVKSVGYGSAYIYARSGGKTAACKVELKPISVTGVTLDRDNLNLTKGNSAALKATVQPANATNKGVRWGSYDTGIATVTQSGTVTAVSGGSTWVYVTTNDGGYYAYCRVNVSVPVSVTGVRLDRSSLPLRTDQGATLTATVVPSNAANKSVTWSTSNSNVATVTSGGYVRAVRPGSAVITVRTADGGKTATCSVTVTSSASSGSSGSSSARSSSSSNARSSSSSTARSSSSSTARSSSSSSARSSSSSVRTNTSDPVRAFVARMYRVVLEREPDADGLNYWTQKLKDGSETGASLMSLFFLGDELTNKHLSNRKYVQLAYKGALGRNPDAEGTAYWVDALDSGTSPQFLVCGCVGSQEFNNMCSSYGIKAGSISVSEERDKNLGVTKFVSRLYTKALGRSYDAGGLNYWCGIINANPSRDNVIQVAMDGCFHSQEFLNKNLSNRDFVTVAYRTFLGREADLEGYNYWLGQLAGGMSRDEMIRNCAYSQEFSNIMASYGL